ncbi:MAG: cystathionine gamma-lyase [Paracoccaceae bacterium]
MTTDDSDRRAADLLHLRGRDLSRGEPLVAPMVHSTMYHLPGDPAGVPGYGRVDNATWQALEKALTHLEGAPALAFPSGMAALSAAFFATLRAGDRLLLPADGYYATRVLAERFLVPLGVGLTLRPTAEFAEGGFAGFRLVMIESPSNPGLDLVDIAAVAAAVRDAGGLSAVDNTTMTPYGQRPLDLGADIVIAADTKAPGGHSDLLMGHVATRDEAILAALSDWRRLSGAIPGPFEAWLLHRSLETLELRFERMCQNAAVIAERLSCHRAVRELRFPGLRGDPGHALAQRQMRRMGFLIGLTLDSAEIAEAMVAACPLLRPATSFGGVHSSAERRARWGDAVAPGFLRLSVGCEPLEELWAALEGALETAIGGK